MAARLALLSAVVLALVAGERKGRAGLRLPVALPSAPRIDWHSTPLASAGYYSVHALVERCSAQRWLAQLPEIACLQPR